jgi:nitroimidazol reductase NimA-like FMN-containing flavoprotein (pyridoxamine 5'-phosphate oxidase superfamily)
LEVAGWDDRGVIDVEALAELQRASFARAGGGLRDSWPQESALDVEELGAFLQAHSYCVLATATTSARPLARPVAFTVCDGSVWLATVEGARLRNLRRNPWVSIVISVGDRGDHEVVVIDGTVNVMASPPERVSAAWATRHGAAPAWADAWAEVRPTRLLSHSARKNH